jgi:ComF family protein
MMNNPSSQIPSESFGGHLAELGRGLLNLVFPPLCVVCRKGLQTGDHEEICRQCASLFNPVPLPACATCCAPLLTGGVEVSRCPRCPPKPVHFDGAVSAFLYQGSAAEAIKAYKFRFRRRLSEIFTEPLVTAFQQRFYDVTINGVIPVPLHKSRQRWREFNQSELLAEHFCSQMNLAMMRDAVCRIRKTPPQTRQVSSSKRLTNIKGAFQVPDPEKVKGGNFLVVDDIFTTGATVNEVASVLKQAGAKKVYILTIARAVK